jgi:hypothetical protein
MSSVIASVKKLFGKITSAVSGVTRKLFGKKKRASRKKNIPANAPVPAPAAPAAPAPVPAPAVPVAPQAAGKMRAKTLRRMKFYKPSRRAVKKGRKLSRRSK